MKLSALIAEYGDDNIEFQNLDECTESFDLTKRGTKARFGTPVGFDMNGFTKLGLVVWFDREKVKAIIAKEKAGQS